MMRSRGLSKVVFGEAPNDQGIVRDLNEIFKLERPSCKVVGLSNVKLEWEGEDASESEVKDEDSGGSEDSGDR